jgi:uncharacterized membrane protein
LEAFSDGVFAIVITLLVIELRPPELDGDESLASALWDMWPGYAAYFVSFAIIGVMWLNHHRMLDPVRVVDGPLLVLNLHLLLWTALIPFPTAVVADYLDEGRDDAQTAVALYGGVILLAAIAFVCLYGWITHDERLLGELPPRDVVTAARVRFGVGLLAYSVAFGVAFLAPYAALALHAAMALYYAFDQATIQRPAT